MKENQDICSMVFEVALKILENTSSNVLITSISTFLSLCISNNVGNQEKFADCNGLLILKRCIEKYYTFISRDMQDCDNAYRDRLCESLGSFIGIMSTVVLDNASNSETVGKIGVISILIKLLSIEYLNSKIKTRLILNLGHCITSCDSNKSYIDDTPNFAGLLRACFSSGDPELAAASKFLLQSYTGNEENEKDENCVTNIQVYPSGTRRTPSFKEKLDTAFDKDQGYSTIPRYTKAKTASESSKSYVTTYAGGTPFKSSSFKSPHNVQAKRPSQSEKHSISGSVRRSHTNTQAKCPSYSEKQSISGSFKRSRTNTPKTPFKTTPREDSLIYSLVSSSSDDSDSVMSKASFFSVFSERNSKFDRSNEVACSEKSKLIMRPALAENTPKLNYSDFESFLKRKRSASLSSSVPKQKRPKNDLTIPNVKEATANDPSGRNGEKHVMFQRSVRKSSASSVRSSHTSINSKQKLNGESTFINPPKVTTNDAIGRSSGEPVLFQTNFGKSSTSSVHSSRSYRPQNFTSPYSPSNIRNPDEINLDSFIDSDCRLEKSFLFDFKGAEKCAEKTGFCGDSVFPVNISKTPVGNNSDLQTEQVNFVFDPNQRQEPTNTFLFSSESNVCNSFDSYFKPNLASSNSENLNSFRPPEVRSSDSIRKFEDNADLNTFASVFKIPPAKPRESSTFQNTRISSPKQSFKNSSLQNDPISNQKNDNSLQIQVIVFPGVTCEAHNLCAEFETLTVISLPEN